MIGHSGERLPLHASIFVTSAHGDRGARVWYPGPNRPELLAISRLVELQGQRPGYAETAVNYNRTCRAGADGWFSSSLNRQLVAETGKTQFGCIGNPSDAQIWRPSGFAY